MIVLDEELQDPKIADRIASWFPGRVTTIRSVRPGTTIKDDAIASLLLRLTRPTFVTINVSDFWHKIEADPHYCVVCVDLPDPRVLEVPDWLRRFLRFPQFKTKARRMGFVARLRVARIEYYSVEQPTQSMTWK